MTGKNYKWHRNWCRDADGHLVHKTGLRMLVTRSAGYIDFATDDASLDGWQKTQLAIGTAPHHLLDRLRRLIKEATMWRDPRLDNEQSTKPNPK